VLPNLSLKVRSAARPVLVVPFALLLLGIAFAILAPRYSPAAASGYALARVSLLWILVPFVAVLIANFRHWISPPDRAKYTPKIIAVRTARGK